ncbi:MAG TPA: alpha/beta hydrolase [Streptosporangiaceae bacterium]|nr:alpha/beta hydrolase [Streptosporangiaceae bacterium]
MPTRNRARNTRARNTRTVCAAVTTVAAVAALVSPAGNQPTAANASIRANGATRDGAPPIVRLVVGATQTMHAPRQRVRQATFAYGTDPAQRFDTYWPTGSASASAASTASAGAGAASLPGILILHGGYWLAGDKSTWRSIARRLAARGYVVFAANYRLSPRAPWPAQLDDAAAALGYIRTHARRFRLDPSRMVVLGSSAGGQLATMLGATGGGRHLRGVVALSPVNAPYQAYVDGGRADASALQRKLRRAITKLVRCAPAGADTAACLFRLAHATPQVTAGAAPMLFVHSRGDFVPPKQSAAVRDALALAGVSADLKDVPGAAHGGGLLRTRPVYTMVARWIDAVTSS